MKTFITLAGLALASLGQAAVNFQPENVGGAATGASAAKAPAFSLAEAGQNAPIDYSRYGAMKEAGSPRYQFLVQYPKELAVAAGAGVYPNTYSLPRDPQFASLKGKVTPKDGERDFFIGDPKTPKENIASWLFSKQAEGARQWFIAENFRAAGLAMQALKAYHALLIHFPETTRLSQNGDWGLALGGEAIQRIKLILRQHPEFNLDFVDAEIKILSPGTLEEKVVSLAPGRFVARTSTQPPNLGAIGVKQVRGKGKVRLVQYNNGHWSLFVDRKPYFVKGLAYQITKIGNSPDLQNMAPWENANDPLIYEKTWADLNRNNQRDPGENKHDGLLMQEMGANTLRIYFGASNKQALRNLYKKHGLRMMMGTAAGVYGLDSGGGWEAGTDYTSPQQQEKMLEAVRKLVMEHKDEPYVLMWCLGNENNYGSANNAPKYPATFAQFLQKAAKLIHKLDPDHPVVYSNGDLGFLDHYARYAPDIDILGTNVYRGKDGMGDLYERVAKEYDRPVVITEFGAPAFTNDRKGENQEAQAEYLEGTWNDIAYNKGGGMGAGNSLGGFVFQWQDEWWKSGAKDPIDQQDHGPGQWAGPFADGMAHEEWFGIMGLGNGHDSPWMRQPRKAYYLLQQKWRGN